MVSALVWLALGSMCRKGRCDDKTSSMQALAQPDIDALAGDTYHRLLWSVVLQVVSIRLVRCSFCVEFGQVNKLPCYKIVRMKPLDLGKRYIYHVVTVNYRS